MLQRGSALRLAYQDRQNMNTGERAQQLAGENARIKRQLAEISGRVGSAKKAAHFAKHLK